jgi:hypothetical protein
MVFLHSRHLRSAIGLSLFSVCMLHADVTLRYKAETKFNASLPPEISQQAGKGMAKAVPLNLVIQFKGSKGFASWGDYITIIDFKKNEATLVDAVGKRYGTAPLDRFTDEMAGAMPELPAEAKAGLGAMKSGFQSRVTGRTDTIRGIEAEEREIVMTMDMPAGANAPAGPMMKMVIQFWTAKAGETLRVPAIHELNGYNLWSNSIMNPVGAIEKMLKQTPGFGDSVVAMMKELRSGSGVLLRTHMDIYMPMMAAMMRSLPAGTPNPLGANFDPDAAFAQMNQEMSEISTDAIPDSVFTVPEGFQPGTVADIMKGMVARLSPAPKR